MLYPIIAILCGSLLLSSFFPKIAKALKPIEGILGLIALVLGVISIFGGLNLLNVTLILAGIILAVNLAPALGKAASALAPMRTVLGIVALVVGVLGFL